MGVILQSLQAAIIRQLHDTRDTLTGGNMRTSCAQKCLFSYKLTQNTRINKLNITAGFNYHGKYISKALVSTGLSPMGRVSVAWCLQLRHWMMRRRVSVLRMSSLLLAGES